MTTWSLVSFGCIYVNDKENKLPSTLDQMYFIVSLICHEIVQCMCIVKSLLVSIFDVTVFCSSIILFLPRQKSDRPGIPSLIDGNLIFNRYCKLNDKTKFLYKIPISSEKNVGRLSKYFSWFCLKCYSRRLFSLEFQRECKKYTLQMNWI